MELKPMSARIKAVEHVYAEDTSQVVPIFRITPGAYAITYMARVTTAFAGVTYPTVKVGDANDTERYMRKQPIENAGDLMSGWPPNSTTFCEAMPVGGYVETEGEREVFATFESVSGNLSSLTAGEIEFFMLVAD